MTDLVNVSQHTAYRDNYMVDIALVPILSKMGKRGLKLRQQALESWDAYLTKEMLTYKDICANEGFDPSKPQQVGYILATRGNILPLTRSNKQLKTDEDTLWALNDPLADTVLKYRKAAKLRGTYIRPVLGKSRMYTHFRQDLATSRLASSDRNVQNIPDIVREIFEPDNETGLWTWLDWSQLEMRIFAYLTQDPVMLDAYATGKDIHTITQLALWPGSDPRDDKYRKPAKTFNFQMIYDASAMGLSKKSRLPIEVCAKHRATWLSHYHYAYEWMLRQAANPLPYAENIFERRLRIPTEGEAHESHIRKCKINYPVQASAAGVVARGMLMCDKYGYDFPIQVHDELVIDGNVDPPEELAHIYPEIDLPFEVKKSPVWV